MPPRRVPTPHGLLAQPARVAARVIARQRLARALEKASPFLVAQDIDPAATIANEEVHDFRVALRRLRSWLRASADLQQNDIGRRERAALRRFARRAGAARDAQVEWRWLTSPEEPFSAPAARAALWLAGDRATVYSRERKDIHRRAAARWPQLVAALAASLAPSGDASATDAPSADAPETLSHHLAPELERHIKTARRALDAIEHRTQVSAIHRARIKVKRLRYLLEAVDTQSRERERAVRHLRQLQDTLGELHDAHVMSARLTPLLVPAKGRRHVRRPALRDLRALRAAVRRRELAAFRRAMDLAAARSDAAMWHDPSAFVRRVLASAPTVALITP